MASTNAERPPRTEEVGAGAKALVIQPTSGWGRLELSELWRYRELAWFLTSRNIKARYRQMALGPLWIILEPLLNAIVFSVIFGGLAQLPSEDIPYPLFVYTAMLPWTFFAKATAQATGSLVNEMNVISKVYFPRLIIPLSAVSSGLADLGMSLLVLLAMMLYFGVAPTLGALLLPLYVGLAGATALAVGSAAATLAVRFRDVRFLVTHGIRILMFATPVVYSAELVREAWPSWFWLYRMNPMYWVVEGFRWGLLGRGEQPDAVMLFPASAVLVLLVGGAFLFRRTERTIVDLL